MAVLRVEGLGKAYKRYAAKRGRMLEWLGARPQHELRWVLRDVSFALEPGEAVGLIGANGAGKSTLLKLIAGTTRATAGRVEPRGTISALLELGVGFHPEFTGRENVYMSGSINGLAPEQIAALMAQIEAFAEIGDYIDEPVRTYSSGMQVRLAFSAATAVRPDILIVDEALSVGDIYFQQKCFDRIREFRDAGTTLLFVTHSMASVYSLCSRAIYLDGGRVQLDGPAKEAIDLYQARTIARTHKQAVPLVIVAPVAAPAAQAAPAADVAQAPLEPETRTPEAPTAASGSYYTEGVTIESVAVRDPDGRAVEVFLSDQRLVIEIVGAFERAVDDPHFGFQIRDRLGQPLFMTTTHGLGARVGGVKKGERRVIRFSLVPRIAPGQYTVTAGIANRALLDGSFEQSLVRHQDAVTFTVVEPLGGTKWAGMINLLPSVEVARVPAS